MMHHLLVVAAGVPNVNPTYDTPATPFINKLVALFLGLVAVAMVLIFFGGLAKAANSLRTGEGGAAVGIVSSIFAALVVAVISTGTAFLNTWAGWLGG